MRFGILFDGSNNYENNTIAHHQCASHDHFPNSPELNCNHYYTSVSPDKKEWEREERRNNESEREEL